MTKEPVYWTTKDGTKIQVEHMDRNHLENVVKMFIRYIQKQQQAVVQSNRKLIVHGEIASEHAEAYEIYMATGMDILSDDQDLQDYL